MNCCFCKQEIKFNETIYKIVPCMILDNFKIEYNFTKENQYCHLECLSDNKQQDDTVQRNNILDLLAI